MVLFMVPEIETQTGLVCMFIHIPVLTTSVAQHQTDKALTNLKLRLTQRTCSEEYCAVFTRSFSKSLVNSLQS